MLGAVCGDIIGSWYEVHTTNDYDFNLFPNGCGFTDDTVLTIAVCDAVLYHDRPVSGFWEERERAREYASRFRQYAHRYPDAGFGQMFQNWARTAELVRQKSYGNGGAMRVIPLAYAYHDIGEVQRQARLNCLYTHNHPEAIRAAQAIASAAFLARNRQSKAVISAYLTERFGYDLSCSWEQARTTCTFDSRADYSALLALTCFLQSFSYEDAVRKAVALGGDADTIACMAGGMAEAYADAVPDDILRPAWRFLDSGLRKTIRAFHQSYIGPLPSCISG